MSNGDSLATLGSKLLVAAKASLGAKFGKVGGYVKAETEKLAVTLRMIAEGVADKSITPEEAHILLNQQKVAAAAVLTASEGMSMLAAQSAINAALASVKDFVNGKLGFPLL